jgi:pimeloyl-ACP methyl ester carboxylesterase
MSISTRQHTIITSHGSLAVEESGQGSLLVLLIHGNSSCRGVFRHQLQGRLAENHRLIAFDLPGHGQSSNAPDPTQSYTRPGLADAAVELLGRELKAGWETDCKPTANVEHRAPGRLDQR